MAEKFQNPPFIFNKYFQEIFPFVRVKQCIFIFPLWQRLCECTTILRYTCIAIDICHVL